VTDAMDIPAPTSGKCRPKEPAATFALRDGDGQTQPVFPRMPVMARIIDKLLIRTPCRSRTRGGEVCVEQHHRLTEFFEVIPIPIIIY